MLRSSGLRIKVVVLGVIVGFLAGGGSAWADFTFGTPKNIGPVVNSSSSDNPFSISSDGLEMYFGSERPGGSGGWDIWITRRTATDDEWGPPENLGPIVNSAEMEYAADISPDGLTLYLISDRPGGLGFADVWVVTRASRDDPWTVPVNVGPPVSSQYDESGVTVSDDGLELYFMSGRRPGGVGDWDMWVCKRSSVTDPWGEPENLSALNSTSKEGFISLSPDGLVIFFDSDRPGGIGDWDLWMSKRASRQEPWMTPLNLGPTINSPDLDAMGALSPDGRMLYFNSTQNVLLGGDWGDIWHAPIIPIVDFNGDGKVDGFEFTKVVDNWGQNMPLYDIGPLPWGDGVVNEADLDVLMQYLQEDTPIRVIVDDFEYYNDSDNLIWETWLDFVVNHTGAIIGYADPPHHEIDTVHGGKQAMPLFYDNDGTVLEGTQFETKGTAFYAEAQRKWDVPQDWTIGGIDMLTLWIHGQPHYLEGTPEPLYIALQDSAGNRAVARHPNPTVITIENWQPWTINLTNFTGVDLRAITMLSIIAGDPSDSTAGGFGGILVDDIELYPSAGSYDPTLMAHWALDETEGTTAFDSIGEHHGDVMGDPVWQPAGGAVNGALLLDGVSDYVATETVRDPSEGPMSVFAWVKGGAPGQVIIAQVLGTNWLMADVSGGCLMTDLKQSGRSGKALVSETVITDGNWHRVGLVWDGTDRSLYVDDILVATDTQTELSGSLGGLNIGCDKNATSGSYWSGLIDDVRIYNRAVKP